MKARFFSNSSSATGAGRCSARLFSAIVAVMALLVLAHEAVAATPPAAPTGLVGKQTALRQITLTWDDPGDSSITGYEYCAVSTSKDNACGETGGIDSTNWHPVPGSNHRSTSHTFSVGSAREYQVSIRARNAHGLSDKAIEDEVVVHPLPEIQIFKDSHRLSRLAVGEGRQETVGVSLSGIAGSSRRPSADVVVTIVGTGDEGVTVTPATLTFTRRNSVRLQTVTVKAARDADGDDGEAVFTLTARSSDTGCLRDGDDCVSPLDMGYDGVSARVTVTVDDDNVAPEFGGEALFEVAENTVSVGTVVATDADDGDAITGYAIAGGADGARFSIDATTGALRFEAAPDYENPADDGSDNAYAVEVTATGGSGDREWSTTQSVTVTVTDVDEAPGAPAAPSISDETPGGFTVSWTAPANTGPAITDYDVQYRAGTSGAWADAGHEGAGLSLTLTGLDAETAYQVQVRATNAEGTGVWSAATTGTTQASPNAAPEFSGDASFEVAENVASVGTVVATDADDGDSITGYAITGGVDRARFAIDGTTGALRFAAAPDYENPTDGASRVPGDTAGNNEYLVVVTATSGSGDRERTATQAIAVTVTDVAEPPGAPAAAVISGETTGGFTVSWTAPANTGPAITDYDVQYRAGTSGAWTDAGHEGTGLTLTLTGLDAETAYQVQVRATNAEGTGVWSATATGTTTAVPNAAPTFSSTDAFSVAENATTVGTVTATDADTLDTITGYAITGGVDGARFAIDGATGALRFEAAPDYENPTDGASRVPGDTAGNNEYLVVVTATSGSGDRERTATQAIAVTVTDVDEAPGAPAAPSISDETPGGFTVSWTAPANTGPAITDYDVQYRAGTSGAWADAGHEGAERTLTLTGLDAETAYQVQVRATNAEGTGVWSATATGTTTAVPNAAPTFSSTDAFSVAENATTVGTVTATDADTLDTITGYAITGGVDGARFAIDGATGALRFEAAPDYENPTDGASRIPGDTAGNNEYLVVVTATSGSGDRARTATQAIAVTVTDVAEPPGAPATTISDATSDGFTVSWTASANTGPEVDQYIVRYRAGRSGAFTKVQFTGAVTTTTLTGLSAGTSYQINVRARNAEGRSIWSRPVMAATLASPNAAPEFDTDDVFSVSENTVSVALISATDVDEGDGITGYAISGGADSARFAIDGATGALRFAAAPDYEAPGDVLSGNPSNAAGNNEYVVVVEATSGSGERARTAEQTITVTVTDVDEAPGAPAAPAVSNETSGGFTVRWTAPENTGPAITDYDVQYRAGSSGEWADAGHEGTERTLALTGLSAETVYQVQVRATNAEGTGTWSEAVTATTSVLPNAAPEFDTDDVFSVSENTVSVAMISATDVDDGDGITGYAIGGGADGARFAIDGTTGALRFAAAPDYETPGDVLSGDPSNAAGNNEYVVVVEATSGSGDRARTAEQTITVTVTNVDEPPAAPAAPAVSNETPGGFTVRWTAPANTGPAITDYDVQYRAGTSGEWADAGHEGTERTLALTGLSAETAYQVQVRASNAEGTGTWSEAVTATTSVLPNAAPEFDTDDVFSVSENTVSVATVSATDVDDGDRITGYAITGGADGARFAINGATGALRFAAAPNYEAPGDALSGDPSNAAGNNEYIVVVTATSGAVDREMTATQTITVTVTDVDEPPGAPVALAVSGETSGGFTVSWTAPANTGPAITNYDVRYRAGTSVAWTDAGHEGTGLSLTLTGLDAETAYRVQVRAVNAEGMGVWSEAAGETARAPEARLPGKPTGLTGEPGDRRVRLEWDALGDASVRKWQYRVRSPGRRNFHAWKNIPGSGAETTSYTVVGGGLFNGETYDFQVRAVNGTPIGRGAHVGAGPASDVARVTVGRVLPAAAGVTVSALEVTVPEGGTASYTVALESRPSASVTIAVAKQPGGDDDLRAAPALAGVHAVELGCRTDGDGGCGRGRGRRRRPRRFRSHGDEPRFRLPCHRDCLGDGGGARHDVRDSVLIRRRRDDFPEELDDERAQPCALPGRARQQAESERDHCGSARDRRGDPYRRLPRRRRQPPRAVLPDLHSLELGYPSAGLAEFPGQMGQRQRRDGGVQPQRPQRGRGL